MLPRVRPILNGMMIFIVVLQKPASASKPPLKEVTTPEYRRDRFIYFSANYPLTQEHLAL